MLVLVLVLVVLVVVVFGRCSVRLCCLDVCAGAGIGVGVKT